MLAVEDARSRSDAARARHPSAESSGFRLDELIWPLPRPLRWFQSRGSSPLAEWVDAACIVIILIGNRLERRSTTSGSGAGGEFSARRSLIAKVIRRF